ncbi:MAG TPA: hypothetical protein VMU50_16965 [Polyangia bacterium]|nr:hypothetical protein [Polyangia bacterium]
MLRLLNTAPPRLAPSARARIAARIERRTVVVGRASGWRLWAVGAVGALILFAGSAVGAAVGVTGFVPVRQVVERWLGFRDPIGAPARDQRRGPAMPSPSPSPVTIEPIPEPSPAPAPVHGARVHLSPKPAPAEMPEPVVAESRLLGGAIEALRQDRAPRRALRVLDRYDHRYPKGVLAPEATAARIDALLALGRKGRALARLEAAPLARLPRTVEMQLLRGELRAARGNPAGAALDFDAVLAAPSATGIVVERALYGRSSCRSRLGDETGARADLEEYLRRFPRGRFAASAGHALSD